jgi:hypothetical protein
MPQKSFRDGAGKPVSGSFEVHEGVITVTV